MLSDRLIVRAPVRETGVLVQVVVTPHALERFIERAMQGLDQAAAARVLGRMALSGQLLATRPPRLGPGIFAPMFLAIADIAFPVAPDAAGRLVAHTCLAAGVHADQRRRAHRRTRRRLAASGRAARHAERQTVRRRADRRRKRRGSRRPAARLGRRRARRRGRAR